MHFEKIFVWSTLLKRSFFKKWEKKKNDLKLKKLELIKPQSFNQHENLKYSWNAKHILNLKIMFVKITSSHLTPSEIMHSYGV